MRVRLFICSLIVFLQNTLSYGQLEQYNYVGVQTFESGEFVSYHLDFEFFGDLIQGRVIVDYGGSDETLYYIKGTYKDDILDFKASYLVWTKSNIPQRDHCVLRFRESVKNLKTVKAFSGSYSSTRSKGQQCSQGLLILSKKIVPELPITIEKEETTVVTEPKEEIKKPRQKEEVVISKPEKQLRSTPIKKDENLNVFAENKVITLVVYDAGKEDNDRINLRINDSIILKDYNILRKKKVIPITLDKGSIIIQVEALNEGNNPPNTVKLEIEDGATKISTRTSLKAGESASLTIINQ